MHPRQMFLGMCIVQMIPFTPRSMVHNEVFPFLSKFFLPAPDSDASSIVVVLMQPGNQEV
jgi:hypothetical protein